MMKARGQGSVGRAVALETTVLAHGVPRERAIGLAEELAAAVRGAGAEPAFVGVVSGEAVVGMSDAQIGAMLAAGEVAKVNSSNLGVCMHRGGHGATTVSATMELAAGAGVRVFATGGIGGVHRGFAESLDISADLAALARYPVAVVSSGVKSILDVRATREALETLGVPVVGFGTDEFPAFYRRESGAGVDARFDDAGELARYLSTELARTGRGVLVANPIPVEEELSAHDWERWLSAAMRRVEGENGGAAAGRDATPRILAALHDLSDGATLRANIALLLSNAKLGGLIAAAMG